MDLGSEGERASSGDEETYGGGKGSEVTRADWSVARVVLSWERRWRVCSRVLRSFSERGVLLMAAISIVCEIICVRFWGLRRVFVGRSITSLRGGLREYEKVK